MKICKKGIKELEKEALVRKQANKEANLQREHWAGFESAPYVMLLADKDGHVTNINLQAQSFVGGPRMNFSVLFAETCSVA